MEAQGADKLALGECDYELLLVALPETQASSGSRTPHGLRPRLCAVTRRRPDFPATRRQSGRWNRLPARVATKEPPEAATCPFPFSESEICSSRSAARADCSRD